MKWFKHDSDAGIDPKLIKLRMRYGMQGYGLYWYCLEKIAYGVSTDNLTFELEHDAEVIAHDSGMHVDDVNAIMTYMIELGLFENSSGIVTCWKLAKRLDKSATSNPNMRKIITEISTKRQDKIRLNLIKSSQNKKESKKENKNKRTIEANASAFASFWSAYPKKKNKGQAEKAFQKLNPDPDLLTLILSGIERAKRTEGWRKQDGQFIPYPATWLNAQGWLDEDSTAQKGPLPKNARIAGEFQYD